MRITKHTHSSQETEAIGVAIGARLRGGEVVELRSDVGGGKTTLTRGIVRGAGSEASVGSPTFTLTKQYDVEPRTGSGLQAIVHADMYRLPDPGIMRHELADVLDDHTTLVIEWANSVEDVLPDERLLIQLAPTSDENERKITLSTPDSLDYLLQDLQGDNT